MIMNTTTEQSAVLNHEAIASLACQIWEKNGRQAGRDQEFWLQAEQQLRASSQQEYGGANHASPPRKVTIATGKKTRGNV